MAGSGYTGRAPLELPPINSYFLAANLPYVQFAHNYHGFQRWPQSPLNRKGAIVPSQPWMHSSISWRLPRSPVLSRQLRPLSVLPASSSRLSGYGPSYSTAMNLRFTYVQDTMANKQDYVELGKSCGRVCQALDRGLNGRRSDELSESVLEAIEELTG